MEKDNEKIEIDEETIKNTTECEENFSCLKSDDHKLCEIEFTVSNRVHFIKCNSELPCKYQHPFGDVFFCSCPVRKEIFNKYKK